MKAFLKATFVFLCLAPAVTPVRASADIVFARPVLRVEVPTEANSAAYGEARSAIAAGTSSPGTYSFVDVYRLSTESQRGLARVGSGGGAGPSGMLEVDALGAPVGLAWSGPASRNRGEASTGLSAVPPARLGAAITETPDASTQAPVDGLALLSGFAVVAFIVLRRAGRASS